MSPLLSRCQVSVESLRRRLHFTHDVIVVLLAGGGVQRFAFGYVGDQTRRVKMSLVCVGVFLSPLSRNKGTELSL